MDYRIIQGECTQTRELMDCQADGGTTSDTGKQSYSNSWGFSSDRSEDDIRIPPIVGHSRSSSVGDGSHGNAMRDSRLLSVPLMTNDNSRGGRSRTDSVVLPQSGRKDDVNKDMLFVSGMIGVKRHPLGTLRCVATSLNNPQEEAKIDISREEQSSRTGICLHDR